MLSSAPAFRYSLIKKSVGYIHLALYNDKVISQSYGKQLRTGHGQFMKGVARNITANAFGGIWSILLNLIAIPLQIRILGTEAYGLIGFITTMQILLVVFDLGLPATVVREVALDHDGEHLFSRTLIRTCSTLYWIVALVVGVIFIATAAWIANHWLHVETIPLDTVTQSLRLLAVYIIFLWPLNIYMSAIAGLQRFDIINVLKIINVTSVQIGGIVILFSTHNLYAFIGWLVLNAFIFLIIHIVVCFDFYPDCLSCQKSLGQLLKGYGNSRSTLI